MKTRVLMLVIFCLGLSLLTARAEIKTTAARPDKTVPGQQIARTISLITGVAISPLMGVGAVGAWEYFHARTPERKASLHWFANPYFWVPALLLVLASFIKDTVGTAMPVVLKKPFDVAETIEHKISGIVLTGAFVPIAAAIFQAQNSSGDGASLAGLGFAALDFSPFYNALLIPLAMLVFFIVFLASNAINILILLSPFSSVDALLKLFRTTIIATVALTAWADPWMGAAWALVIIGFSWFIAGWSFRLAHFGLAFIWDFVTRRCNRFKPGPTENKMFLGRKINRVPTRSYGRLSRDEKGSLVFTHRPWLVLPKISLTLPESSYAAGRGFFYSEILQLEGDNARIALLLPPRYRSHELELVPIYGLTGVRETGLLAAWQWIRFMLGLKTKTVAG